LGQPDGFGIDHLLSELSVGIRARFQSGRLISLNISETLRDQSLQYRDTKQENPDPIEPLLIEQVFESNETYFLFRSPFCP
jgi:hypothetical protein